MPQFQADVDFDVYCGNCGAAMCDHCEESVERGNRILRVEVCQKCLTEAEDKSYESGRQEGYKEAREELDKE